MLSRRVSMVAALGLVLTCACGNHNYQGGGRRHELPISDPSGGTSGSVTTDGDSSNGDGEGGAPLDEGTGGSSGTAGGGAFAGTAGYAGGGAGTTGGFSGGPGLQ